MSQLIGRRNVRKTLRQRRPKGGGGTAAPCAEPRDEPQPGHAAVRAVAGDKETQEVSRAGSGDMAVTSGFLEKCEQHSLCGEQSLPAPFAARKDRGASERCAGVALLVRSSGSAPAGDGGWPRPHRLGGPLRRCPHENGSLRSSWFVGRNAKPYHGNQVFHGILTVLSKPFIDDCHETVKIERHDVFPLGG